MKYRITKDCCTSWGNGEKLNAWGLSASQKRLAEKVEPGDVLFHFIDGVRSWAGYSTVTGSVQPNDRDELHAIRLALPFVIPIEPRVWLTAAQCELSGEIPGLSHQFFYRQATFNSIRIADAERIKEAIDSASLNDTAEMSEKFRARWSSDAERYYKTNVKGGAYGACRLCREDIDAWSERVGNLLTSEELESIKLSFLDAAHIEANSKGGSMEPENLRALCPSCHRVVDRLSDDRRKELLYELD